MTSEHDNCLPAPQRTESAGVRKLYSVRKVTTPVAGSEDAPGNTSAEASTASGSQLTPASPPNPPQSPFLRAACEDDDGYDPYSDRREELPLFEANPWA